MAKLLSGAWRLPPLPPPDITADELGEIQDLLLESGTGPMTWRRIRASALSETAAGKRLHTAYRLQSLKAAQRELQIGRLATRFKAHWIDPILIKGWALARLYPETGLRPYNDVDLLIPATQAKAVLSLIEDVQDPRVDLEHDHVTRFDRRTWSDLHRRSQVIDLGNTEMRVLSAEDELRAQCIHFLKHGGCAPLSLVDIALLVENRSSRFDWDVCLGEDRRQRSWVACALRLAHDLLEMNLEGVPLDFTAEELPNWVSTTVLEQWGKLPNAYQADVRTCLRHPAKIVEAIADRWPPNPIVATLTSGSRFGTWPVAAMQIADVGLRFGRWLRAGARTVSSQQGIGTEWA